MLAIFKCSKSKLTLDITVKVYLLENKVDPTFNVRSSWEQDCFYSWLWPRISYDIYISIMVIYYIFINYGLSRSNS